eukprot:CAMPEP_0184686822 /NCGR_PEP_ID=MMETSP0312-20130426/24162_1 /TAXON_ID=31354 /ORGANISM="Compsopogon coeruleus, Strain SAG 36.94" /LENGTH=33 /DNA_ID= /DNA_START= /DNA_END= /DNA_ORIENTATION=
MAKAIGPDSASSGTWADAMLRVAEGSAKCKECS